MNMSKSIYSGIPGLLTYPPHSRAPPHVCNPRMGGDHFRGCTCRPRAQTGAGGTPLPIPSLFTYCSELRTLPGCARGPGFPSPPLHANKSGKHTLCLRPPVCTCLSRSIPLSLPLHAGHPPGTSSPGLRSQSQRGCVPD